MGRRAALGSTGPLSASARLSASIVFGGTCRVQQRTGRPTVESRVEGQRPRRRKQLGTAGAQAHARGLLGRAGPDTHRLNPRAVLARRLPEVRDFRLQLPARAASPTLVTASSSRRRLPHPRAVTHGSERREGARTAFARSAPAGGRAGGACAACEATPPSHATRSGRRGQQRAAGRQVGDGRQATSPHLRLLLPQPLQPIGQGHLVLLALPACARAGSGAGSCRAALRWHADRRRHGSLAGRGGPRGAAAGRFWSRSSFSFWCRGSRGLALCARVQQRALVREARPRVPVNGKACVHACAGEPGGVAASRDARFCAARRCFRREERAHPARVGRCSCARHAGQQLESRARERPRKAQSPWRSSRSNACGRAVGILCGRQRR